jgi:BirA family biotin operon repressor/biotin-[acetyl-CoA-carboxylase] ligase
MSKPFTTLGDIGAPAIPAARGLSGAGGPSGAGRPLDAGWLRSRVLSPGGFWAALDVVAETGSTSEDLLAAAGAGAAHGTVLAAEVQTRGRGRQGRRWTSPAGGLMFSVLLRPAAVPPPGRGWLPLLAGVAVVRAVRAQGVAGAVLKWPNDVLAGGAKLAGILAEQAGDAIVVGIGINVGTGPADLPPAAPGGLPPASMALSGAPGADRGALLAGILAEVAAWYPAWTASGPLASGLRAEYLRCCATIGGNVRVELPGGAVLHGIATDIDEVGRLVVDTGDGPVPVSAGDVIHLR